MYYQKNQVPVTNLRKRQANCFDQCPFRCVNSILGIFMVTNSGWLVWDLVIGLDLTSRSPLLTQRTP